MSGKLKRTALVSLLVAIGVAWCAASARAAKWPQPGGLGSPVEVSYSYSNLFDGGLQRSPSLDEYEMVLAVEEALGLWASVAPLTFVEREDSGPLPDDDDTSYAARNHPQIRIGHHGLEDDAAAHAYYPGFFGLAGDAHFDSSGRTWGEILFLYVAAHEFGHSLGLDHIEDVTALMNSTADPARFGGLGGSRLWQPDIDAVQDLYGSGSGEVVTTRVWCGCGGDGNWETHANWDQAWQPTANSNVYINDGSTVNITTGDRSAGSLSLNNGTLNLDDGMLNVSRDELIGQTASSYFIQTDGTHTVADTLYLGRETGSSGAYELFGGELSSDNEVIGRSGQGYFTQWDGTHTVTGDLTLGVVPGSTGVYRLAGGALIVGGNVSSGLGTSSLIVDGGTLSVGGEVTTSGRGRLVLGSGDATIDVPAGVTLTLNPMDPPVVSGDLTKDGLGTLVLSSGVAVGGAVNFNDGELEVGPGVLALPGGDVNIGDGLNLVVSGHVGRQVTGTGDSRITVSGPTSIGVLDSPDGYSFGGFLDVGPHLVGLVDPGKAELRGAGLEGGTLSSFTGIRLGPFSPPDLTTALTGEGTVIGLLTGSEEGKRPAFVWGEGTGIKIIGIVDGNPTLVNVDLRDALFQPGFSPAYTAIGSGPAMQVGTTEFEIGGTTAGEVVGTPGFFGELKAGDCTQLYAFRGRAVDGTDFDLEIPVNGPIKLILTSEFVPTEGADFVLIQTGEYQNWDRTMLEPAILTYQTPAGPSLDIAQAPLPAGLDWVLVPSANQLLLKVIPEPGTLVLLASGGLALLLWRRRPKAAWRSPP